MKSPKINARFKPIGPIGSLLLIAMFTSCSSADIEAVTTAVSALEQNKQLAEQFVKDVKGAYDPGDPQSRSVMALYEQARDTYNDYISQVEGAASNGRTLTISQESTENVRQTAVDFISAATRSLDPS